MGKRPDILPMLDYSKVVDYITRHLRQYFLKHAKRGVGVIGLSGGLDSSVVAYLSVKALGKGGTRLYLMPSNVTPKEDLEDAMQIIELLEIPEENWREIKIDDVLEVFERILGHLGKLEMGNIMARVRMTMLYHEAAINKGLVIGTSDKSEILMGYFTKYGDGGADVLPIASLYKTQVRQLAEYLGIPERIRTKPPSPALWSGQTAEGELGAEYSMLDAMLYLKFDRGFRKERIQKTLGISPEIVEMFLKRARLNQHKRQLPKSFPIDYKGMRLKKRV